MDSKELQLLDELYNKLLTRTFSEIDIYSFYILIRDYVKCNYPPGILLDLGDFIAHRKRNQGILFKKFIQLHKYMFGDYEKKDEALRCMKDIPVFPIIEFKSELNDLLERLGKVSLDDDIIKEILLFTYSLLQSSIYEKGDMKGYIFTFLTHDNIALVANLSKDTPYYFFAKLEIYLSVNDEDWWKENWHSIFNTLRKTPFTIKRDSKNEPVVYLNGYIL